MESLEKLADDLLLSPEIGVELADRHVRLVGDLLHARLFDSLLREELRGRGDDLPLAARSLALLSLDSLRVLLRCIFSDHSIRTDIQNQNSDSEYTFTPIDTQADNAMFPEKRAGACPVDYEAIRTATCQKYSHGDARGDARAAFRPGRYPFFSTGADAPARGRNRAASTRLPMRPLSIVRHRTDRGRTVRVASAVHTNAGGAAREALHRHAFLKSPECRSRRRNRIGDGGPEFRESAR